MPAPASGSRCAVLWQSKLPDGRPDYDIKILSGVQIDGADLDFKIYEQGFICNRATLTIGEQFLEIACGEMIWGILAE